MIKKRILICGLFLIGLATLNSCSTMTDLKEAIFGDGKDYVIHLHTGTAKRTDANEMNYVEIEGKFVYLDTRPLISSKAVRKIEVIDKAADKKGLRLILTGHGRMKWMQVTARLRAKSNKKVFVMLDDDYKGWFDVYRIEQRGIITLNGPFTKKEVENIIEKAEDAN